MPIRTLTDDEFDSFVVENSLAVVMFDAPWDVGPGMAIRPSWEQAHERFAEYVAFGEVNTDLHRRSAASLRVENVPTVFYYRDSKLVQRVVGVHEIRLRVKTLIGQRLPASHDGDFCELYVDIRLNESRLEELLAQQLHGVKDRCYIICSWGDLCVRKNDAYRWWKPSSNDAFLYSRFVIELDRTEKATHAEYIQGVREVMTSLRGRSARVVAACDFEDELDQSDWSRAKARYPT